MGPDFTTTPAPSTADFGTLNELLREAETFRVTVGRDFDAVLELVATQGRGDFPLAVVQWSRHLDAWRDSLI